MKHFLSVDGGGSKISAILFNDQWELVGTGTGGSTNSNHSTIDHVKASMHKCIEECLGGKTNLKIEKIYWAASDGAEIFINMLGDRAKLGESIYFSEGKMCLLAGIQQSIGLVALSGTGSAAYAIDGEHERVVGGWGSLLGDEGSGYSIGKAGIQAAIRCCEEWGPKTMIIDAIKKRWCPESIREIIYSIYRSEFPTGTIASVAELVSEAALSGDSIAIGIYESAGASMARQVITLLQAQAKEKHTVVISGGTWKGSKRMYERFCENVQTSFPGSDIHLPLFEPVMGGVIAESISTDRMSDSWKRIKSNFHTLRYKTKW